MEKINVKTAHTAYPVFLGEGAIDELSDVITTLKPEVTSILFIVDETVDQIHGSYIKQSFPVHERIHWHVIPSGEQSKTFEVYQQVLGEALSAGLDRHSLIIACGGGATGDLAGFVAASYMRGIRFIQMPTTILAHDSAVGGKVAINHPLGKNMVGSFHQPIAVVYDVNFLKTLPVSEIRSGFAEVIKHAIISDHKWLAGLMKSVHSFESLDSEILIDCLKKGIQVKAEIVEQDEKELGIRAHLNFGHTYGHAIEAWAGYGKWSHGESIMVGMVYALLLSKKINHLDFNLSSFTNWIQSLGYEIGPPSSASFDELLNIMLKDKKTIAQEIRFVLLDQNGNPKIQKVSVQLLMEVDTLIRNSKGEIQ